jgi:transcriptional regulator with XRE-family HTH domain
VDKVLGRLKAEFAGKESRYAYADTVINAFLAAQIKALREDRGLTQEDLAELVGTQQSGISRWLNSGFSSCKIESLRKFARAFGVRLRVSFEEFGTLPSDVGGFTKERLAPRRFEDDPAFKNGIASGEENGSALLQRAPTANGVNGQQSSGFRTQPTSPIPLREEIERPRVGRKGRNHTNRGRGSHESKPKGVERTGQLFAGRDEDIGTAAGRTTVAV